MPVTLAPANCYFYVGLSGKLYSVNTRGLRFSGDPGFISGAKHDFLYRFFALITIFLARRLYLPGNDSFIKSSSKNYENLNLDSYDP